MKLKVKLISLWGIFYDRKKPDLTPLSEAQYQTILARTGKSKAEKALERAWATRNFEIELYWKRANYFWAFTASTFVGYFALVNSENYTKPNKFDHVEVFCVICIGFILSIAWFLINKGSKQWQRNWEAHVDLLEDRFTGPLYKVVNPTITYSVSHINEIVSFSFATVWIILGIKYLFEQNLIGTKTCNVNWFVISAILGVVAAVCAMTLGYGRGRFGHRRITMYQRKVTFIQY